MYKMCSNVSTGARIFFSPDEQEIKNLQGTLIGVQKLMGNTFCHFFQQHKAQRNAL